jgi:rSAM/selenodomain-associated transferase 2
VLSVVIPTLEAAPSLAATVESLGGAPFPLEIVVTDGGSVDATCEVASDLGAVVVGAPRGRGIQLAAGAFVAKGEWLLFLHADTRLGKGWAEVAAEFMAVPGNESRAGVFRFALDDRTPAARRIERMVAWRCRRLGLPYGDQGLLMTRTFYDTLGGFRPLSLFEDVEMVRRIGRDRLTFLDVPAVTSAARYRRDGYLARPLRNLLCLGLYFMGVPPRRIARIYG